MHLLLQPMRQLTVDKKSTSLREHIRFPKRSALLLALALPRRVRSKDCFVCNKVISLKEWVLLLATVFLCIHVPTKSLKPLQSLYYEIYYKKKEDNVSDDGNKYKNMEQNVYMRLHSEFPAVHFAVHC